MAEKGNGAMHVIFKYLLWIVGIYVAYCFFLVLMQRTVMFPRHMIQPPDAGSGSMPGLEKIWLDTDYGKIETWYLPPVQPTVSKSTPVVIFAHGNGELIDFWPEELLVFSQLGWGILLVEYPGYGRSQGSPSQKSVTHTFIKAYDLITAKKGIDRDKIILFGRSLGGGAACALSLERPVAALILMSAFKSAKSFAHRYLVPEFLVRDPFDNLTAVSKFVGPILIMHGKWDEVIPYGHGVALAKAAKQAKLLSYECGHNDFPPGWFGFRSEVEKFLEETGLQVIVTSKPTKGDEA